MTDVIWAAIIGSGGVVLGSLITLLGLWWQSSLQAKREEKIYLKSKRAELYEKLYDFLMRLEKDIRIRKTTYMSKETKDFYNILEQQTIWASNEVAEYFYDLSQELSESVDDYKSDKDEAHTINNEKILEFKDHIRKELGIKD